MISSILYVMFLSLSLWWFMSIYFVLFSFFFFFKESGFWFITFIYFSVFCLINFCFYLYCFLACAFFCFNFNLPFCVRNLNHIFSFFHFWNRNLRLETLLFSLLWCLDTDVEVFIGIIFQKFFNFWSYHTIYVLLYQTIRSNIFITECAFYLEVPFVLYTVLHLEDFLVWNQDFNPGFLIVFIYLANLYLTLY